MPVSTFADLSSYLPVADFETAIPARSGAGQVACLGLGIGGPLAGVPLFVSSAGIAKLTPVTGITAGTTQTQAGATALTASYNWIGTCANVNDGVKLPTAAAGQWCWIYNGGAQNLKIWPASGDDLGAGVDAADATALATTKSRLYWCKDGTTWVSSLSLA